MEDKDIIRKELQGLCPAVANLARTNLYAVPDGYFQKLGDQIIQYVKQNEEPDLKISLAMPYNVPSGYFNGLADRILNKAKQQGSGSDVREELNSIAPFLNSISKEPVFSVPENYFADFRVQTTQQAPAKVVKMGKVQKTFRYAVAAVVIGIVAVTSLFIFNKEESTSEISYKPEEIKTLTDKEIVEFLNTTSYAEATFNNSTYLQPTQDYNEYMKTLTEEEIEEFLNENGATEENSKEG